MDYFRKLHDLLQKEKEAERRFFERQNQTLPVTQRRAYGITWFPIVIKDTEMGVADYLIVECERPTHQEIIHQFRFGMSVALFSNHDAKNDRVEGIISYLSGNRMKITLRTDELPDWAGNGKLGVDAVFDKNSYEEMERALKLAPVIAEQKEQGRLVRLITGQEEARPSENDRDSFTEPPAANLNASQKRAVENILGAGELAIVHGPPGTGKTTTIVEAIRLLKQQENQTILAVAPSNTAVDLLSEKLNAKGLRVIRIGNPARVSESLSALTLDSKITDHPANKEIKRLKRQANEYRNMAHKYKRSFGPSEREQRKALFAEAHKLLKDVERTEQYIVEDILSNADVITATLVGSNHYTVRGLRYNTVVIDEAGQSLEPACWIPILKAKRLVLAGDHQQLPPVIKNEEQSGGGLEITLLEKLVARYPSCVVMLDQQYRMHEKIMAYSSRVFYNNLLKADISVVDKLLFPGDHPLVFIDTAGCGFEEEKDGTAISNPEEGAFLLKLLQNYLTEIETHFPQNTVPSIGVISPYKRQVEMLKEKVTQYPTLVMAQRALTINTIDSFQGQEREIVFISLVRSNSENVIGFLGELRRMNVAMTRAKKKLVVIGDSATLSQHPFYAGFIDYAQEQEGYHSAWEFMAD
jgi:ATP-dependent RNA/DNA helicase IGHMBP2